MKSVCPAAPRSRAGLVVVLDVQGFESFTPPVKVQVTSPGWDHGRGLAVPGAIRLADDTAPAGVSLTRTGKGDRVGKGKACRRCARTPRSGGATAYQQAIVEKLNTKPSA